jgi:antitoxin VapB
LMRGANVIYIHNVHQVAEDSMADTGIAKIFMHGRSQAVRLPLAFRLPGDRVRVRRVEGGILLEPIVTDLDTWFAELDRFADVPFMENGRRQPPMPEPKDPFA